MPAIRERYRYLRLYYKKRAQQTEDASAFIIAETLIRDAYAALR